MISIPFIDIIFSKILFQQGAAQLMKNSLDRKFGSTWHCVIGEGFGFDISCQRRYLLHIYYGMVGIVCYKMGS